MDRTYDDRMFIETFEHEYTWLNGYLRNVRRYSARPALIDPVRDKTWTYKELDEEVNMLANALKADHVGKNDVVMSILNNCPEFCFTYIAPRKVGAIVSLVNFKLAPGEMARLIEHNEPKVVIYLAEMKDIVDEAAKMSSYKPLRMIMADNLENEDLPLGHIHYESYIKHHSKESPAFDFPHHIYDEVVRMCTSGTSALPKNVPINDINEVLSAHDAIMHYPLNCHDVCMNMTPLFHRGGSHSGGTCPTFYVGAALVLMRAFSPRVTLINVEKYKITYLTGSPSSLEMLARTQEKDPVDLSSLRGLVTMGAPLDKAACERFLKVLTPNILNGYGTTETFWNSFLRPYDLPEKAGSVGGSCVDDEVRVVKVYEDHKAEPNEMVPMDGETVGEVILYCPGKTTYSYYKNPEEQERKFYKGWMYTNDLGYWDETTYVTITGRKDDMIISAGENVYPTQVEEAINEFEKVSDCMVTSVPDAARGQAIAAYVVPKDDSLTIREVFDHCLNTPMLSAYKRPRWYRIVDSLPMTATGKKMHYALKQQAAKDLEAGLLKRK